MHIQEGIKTIMTGQDLSREEISSVMNQILTGSASEAQIGAFLVSLSFKGEEGEGRGKGGKGRGKGRVF